MFKKLIWAATAVVTLGISNAYAGPTYLSFGAENGGAGTLNYGGFANYTVSQGSVDLIGNGYFDNFPGNGLYIDLAGSTGQFGALTTKAIFAPGTYHIGLSLGGPIYSVYGGNALTDGANVSWGEGPGMNFILAGLTTGDFNFDVTLLNAEAFTIADLGLSGNGNIGSTLFGFQVTAARPVQNEQPIPEPITMSLFGAGVIGLGATRRRKKAIQA